MKQLPGKAQINTCGYQLQEKRTDLRICSFRAHEWQTLVLRDVRPGVMC